MKPVQQFLLVFLTALGTTLILTPVVGRLALRYGFMDVPTKPKHVHRQPTPRLGGVSIYAAFLVAVGLTAGLPRDDVKEWARVLGVLLGLTLLMLMGVLDDRRELPPVAQLVVLLLASGLVILAGVPLIGAINNPLGWPIDFPLWFSALFTLFWLTGMTVTVNWLDGLDGLASGITFIASVILFFHTAFRQVPPQPSIALLPAALAGCALGFLPYNFHPARIFLGSSGAYFLGFALANLSIIGGAKVATALLVLGVPILDVAWQIVVRMRQRRSPFLGDRGHLHHRLYDLGLSQRRVVLVYYGLCGAFGLLALVLPSPIYKLYALVSMGLIAAVVLWLVAHQSAGPQ